MSEPLPTAAGLWNRDVPHDARQALFGGAGIVRVWALTAAPMPPFTAVLGCELEPSASVGPHLQEHFPELVLGISGQGHVTVNGVASAFGEGVVVQLAQGKILSIANGSSQEPLRYLIIKAQAG